MNNVIGTLYSDLQWCAVYCSVWLLYSANKAFLRMLLVFETSSVQDELLFLLLNVYSI